MEEQFLSTFPDAWRFIMKTVQQIAPKTEKAWSRSKELDAIAYHIGIPTRQFKAYLRDGDAFISEQIANSSNKHTEKRIQKIVEFYWSTSNEGNQLWRLSNIGSQILSLDHGNFDLIDEYVGKQTCLFADRNNKIHTLDFEIHRASTKGPHHFKFSQPHKGQDLDEEILLDFQGVIFPIAGKIVFMGLGMNASGRYFRIINAHQAEMPAREVTFGLLSGTTVSDKLPFTSRIAFLPATSWLRLRGNSQFAKSIENRLLMKDGFTSSGLAMTPTIPPVLIPE